MRPKRVILCVDDDAEQLGVRLFLLETRGYRVLAASSAAEALSLFRAHAVDLVLSDLVMPEMDGNAMAQRMKRMKPEIPVVLVSGCVRNYERARGADLFLPKGFCSPVEILERVRVLIARKRGPKKTPVSEAPGAARITRMAEEAQTA